jgi:hypothetical protein
MSDEFLTPNSQLLTPNSQLLTRVFLKGEGHIMTTKTKRIG